jgi:predicted exporter
LKSRQWALWVWAVLVAVVLAHNGYLWWRQRLAPDTDILALLPAERRDPARQRALDQMIAAARQKLIVLIGAPDWDDARRAAAEYRKTLAPCSELIDDPGTITASRQNDWLESFRNHRLTLLTTEDDRALRSQGRQFWLDDALAKLYGPFPGPRPLAWQDDPFGWFSNWLQQRARETPVRPRNGVLSVSDSERHYVVLPLTLRVPAFALTGQQAVIPVLEQARHAARQTAPTIEVIQAGIVLHAAAAAGQARQEMSIIGVGSLAGILFLVWLTFRSLKPIALVALSIAVGYLGALSISSFVFERIHLITLVFGASLIGVAQDYGIYFFCQRMGADEQLDSWQLLRRILPALILTLVTTLIGYLGLILTPFPGLRQMAVFSASGLLFAWLTVVCWFPNLVQTNRRESRGVTARWGIILSHWPRFTYERRALVAALALVGLIGFGALQLTAQDDIRALQNSPKELIDDQLKVGKILDLATPAQFFLLRGTSADALLEREEQLKQRLDLLIQRNEFTGYHAISNWVASARLQRERRQAIDQVILSDDGALALLGQKLGADSNWLSAARARLLGAAAPLTVEEFFKSPASEPWRHLWLGQVGDEHASIVALRGVNRNSLPALRQAAMGLQGVEWVDQVGDISSIIGDYRRYMGWVILVSYFIVYALLYPRYGGNSWRVLAPTALASLLALALLGIGGQGLQLFHLLAFMLLLGIGVDYGIFMQEPGSQRDGAAWLAVGISALSTLLSFGLLGLSHTPALRAFGLTMTIGIGVAALIVPCFRVASSAPPTLR